MIATILLTAAIAAHPLDPLSVDQLVELTLHQDRAEVAAVIDLAEVPTKQLTPDCAAFASQLDTRVGGTALQWTVQSQLLERQGPAGLETSRLTCKLSAPAALGAPATIAVANQYLPDRTGMQQIVVNGNEVSPTADLPAFFRSADFSVQPGAAAAVTTGTVAADTVERGWLQRGEDWLARALGDATPLVLLLAVLLSALLGAAHAALPGHGKTVMALYMAGRQGRRRDAVIVGGTVTLTHTASVLILGLATTAFAGLATESALKWLGLASGVLITLVGAGILINGLRHRHAHHHHHHYDHHHHGGHHHHHHHDHHHDGRKSLTALGIAGGLVPSPTALVVLLGAAALGRLWLGVVLIVVYGLGMAATLTAAGLLLLRVRDRWAWLGRLAVPAEATGSVIIVLGFGLAARAALAL
ncbi:sulfite exporter TauE/SafE family protein [Allorhizocola rhizosphaerae]|uniref:urease accessory protein UreH domain-containing protein n=1 Tax=Allorhizocola rhizosphaerae TaxID=1872709 RepID=UPI000E3D4B5C|nr:sulfite exporter TauE/SafE family protein [Allorhizocola rhizosphaerae]